MQDVAQLPVALDQGRRQAGAVGSGNADSLKIDTDQLVGSHGLGKAGGHIVAVSAVEEFHPVDLPRPQRRETGR